MPFNPTLPMNGSQVSSAELRGQFTSLKALIDAQAGLISDLEGARDALQDQINTLQAELSLVPPGAAEVIDYYSPGPGEAHFEIAASRASQMLLYRKGPSDPDFVSESVPALVYDVTGLETGIHMFKAAGVNNGGVGPVSTPVQLPVA